MKPKPLAWGETYTALKEGIVEGEGNTFSFLLDAEHEDILKYAFASQHNYSMQILSANKKWWEELDPQVRSIIREAAAEALKYQREVLAPQSEEEAVKRFMADGLEVSKPSEAELEELKRKTRPVWNLFRITLSQELIDLVVATHAVSWFCLQDESMKEDLSFLRSLYLSHKAITLKRGGGRGGPFVLLLCPGTAPAGDESPGRLLQSMTKKPKFFFTLHLFF